MTKGKATHQYIGVAHCSGPCVTSHGTISPLWANLNAVFSCCVLTFFYVLLEELVLGPPEQQESEEDAPSTTEILAEGLSTCHRAEMMQEKNCLMPLSSLKPEDKTPKQVIQTVESPRVCSGAGTTTRIEFDVIPFHHWPEDHLGSCFPEWSSQAVEGKWVHTHLCEKFRKMEKVCASVLWFNHAAQKGSVVLCPGCPLSA